MPDKLVSKGAAAVNKLLSGSTQGGDAPQAGTTPLVEDAAAADNTPASSAGAAAEGAAEGAAEHDAWKSHGGEGGDGRQLEVVKGKGAGWLRGGERSRVGVWA